MNEGRELATATLLPNGMVLIAGGLGDTGPLASTEIYNPTTNTFTPSTPSMNAPRYGATATLLPNGTVLIAGGGNNTGFLATTEIYDPAANTRTIYA